jgi:hypothetical protein
MSFPTGSPRGSTTSPPTGVPDRGSRSAFAPVRSEPLPFLASGPATAVAGAVLTLACVVVASTSVPAAVAAVLAAVGICVTAARPDLAVLLVVWTVPLVPGFARGAVVPGLKISEVLVVGVAALVLLLAGYRGDARYQAVDWLLLAFCGLGLVLGVGQSLLRGSALDAESLGVLVAPLQFFLLLRLVRIALPGERARILALRGVLGGSLLVFVTAAAQTAGFGPVTGVLTTLTRAVFDGRATGPFAHWHDLAGYAFVVVVLATALLVTPGQRVAPRWVLAATVVAGVGSLALSLTAIATIGTVIALALLAVQTRTVARMALLGAGAALVGAVVAGPALFTRITNELATTTAGSALDPTSFLPQSLGYRWQVWTEQTIPALVPYLSFGFGPGLPSDVQWEYTESLYLTLLLRGGIPLLVLFCFLLLVVWSGARAARTDPVPEVRALALTLVCAVPAALVMNTTNPYFVNNGLPQVFWLLVGLLATRSALEPGRPAAPVEVPGHRHLVVVP